MKFIKVQIYVMAINNKRYKTKDAYIDIDSIAMVTQPVNDDFGTSIFIKNCKYSPVFVKESVDEVMELINSNL